MLTIALFVTTLGLVPKPERLTMCEGTLSAEAIVVGDGAPAASATAETLSRWMALPIVASADGRRVITLRLVGASITRDAAKEPPLDLRDEAFTLDITPTGAEVKAAQPAGLFYGAQTLAQLADARPLRGAHLPARALPCVHISDAPLYRVRAMHLDTSRHFFSPEVVARYVDLLSFYRFNVFHWHLTDDQGFRAEIRAHPELTRVSGVSDFYTQAEMAGVVTTAQRAFITVVPEIEMPGHARAILASHPELSCTGEKKPVPSTWGVFKDVLCAGNDDTFVLLGDILREILAIFPSRLIHVGGDEVPKLRWSECAKCKGRMARAGLTIDTLQGDFAKRVSSLLGTRRAGLWDEALEGGMPANGVIFAWQNVARGQLAARSGFDVVMVPTDTTYFNDADIPWQKVLAFAPRAGLSPPDATRVLGGEGALWTELIDSEAGLDALLMPRLAALSEALWSGASTPDDFGARFTAQRPLFDAAHVPYAVSPPEGLLPYTRVFTDSTTVTLAAPALHPDAVVRFTRDGSAPSETSPRVVGPITVEATTTLRARAFLPGGRSSGVVSEVFKRAALKRALIEPAALSSGVTFAYFEANDLTHLPDLTKRKPLKRGRLPALGFDPAFRPNQFAVRYSAWVRAPADGVYRFFATSDDGVVLRVDDDEVLNDDSVHAPREVIGEVGLRRGAHRVTLDFFQGGGGKTLKLECEGPGLIRQACDLDAPP